MPSTPPCTRTNGLKAKATRRTSRTPSKVDLEGGTTEGTVKGGAHIHGTAAQVLHLTQHSLAIFEPLVTERFPRRLAVALPAIASLLEVPLHSCSDQADKGALNDRQLDFWDC